MYVMDKDGELLHVRITCVKYNKYYKGKIYYPVKFYQDLP